MSSFPVLAAVLATVTLAGCGSGISLDEPIEGRVWQLTQLGDQPVDPALSPQLIPTVSFDAATSRVSGSGGCNRMSGSYSRGIGTLLISQLAATRMGCEKGQMATESGFFTALQTTASYRLQGTSQLTLVDASGRVLGTLASGGGR